MARRVCFVIPAHDEANTVAEVVGRALAIVNGAEVVVVNDGSTDDTSRIAAQAGATVIDLPFNCGYGVALHTGLRWALRTGADFVVTLDADGQHDASDARKLMEPVTSGRADMVLGTRYVDDGAQYHVPLLRRAGSRLFAIGASLITHRNITDPTSGFLCLGRKALAVLVGMADFPEKTPDADVLVYAHRQGLRIEEVPVHMYADRGPGSMHGLVKSILYCPKMLLALLAVLIGPRRA